MLNYMVVFLLSGLWHGSSFNFILWGLYFGIILVFEKLILLDILKKLPNFIKHFYTMIYIFYFPIIRDLASNINAR